VVEFLKVDDVPECPPPHISINGYPVVLIESFSADIHVTGGYPVGNRGSTTYHYSDGTKLTILQGDYLPTQKLDAENS